MAININTMRIGGKHEGDQRVKLPVYASGSGTGNEVLTMDHPMRELYFANDSVGDNSLTLVISGDAALSLTFTLKAGETINERFPEFNLVTITATDDWRWYVRSGRVT